MVSCAHSFLFPVPISSHSPFLSFVFNFASFSLFKSSSGRQTSDIPQGIVSAQPGLCLHAPQSLLLQPKEYIKIDTGLGLQLHADFIATLAPSQLLTNNKVTLLSNIILHQPSTTLHLILYNNGHQPFFLHRGGDLAEILTLNKKTGIRLPLPTPTEWWRDVPEDWDGNRQNQQQIIAHPCFHPCYNSSHTPRGLNLCSINQHEVQSVQNFP
jgi:dUTPase